MASLDFYFLGLNYGLVIGGFTFMLARGLSCLVHIFQNII